MQDPEWPDRPAADARPLSSLAPGHRGRIAWIAPQARRELLRDGLRPGCQVTVGSRTPLGGPIVIEASHARIAISSAVARLIRVRPEPGP